MGSKFCVVPGKRGPSTVSATVTGIEACRFLSTGAEASSTSAGRLLVRMLHEFSYAGVNLENSHRDFQSKEPRELYQKSSTYHPFRTGQ